MSAGKGMLTVAVVVLGGITAIGALSTPDERPTTPPSSSASGYSHEVLQRDAAMTQRMSAPDADGPMQRYQVVDPQLEHSRQVGFVDALEAHVADVDRMLATPAP